MKKVEYRNGFGLPWTPLTELRVVRFLKFYKKNYMPKKEDSVNITGALLFEYDQVGDAIYEVLLSTAIGSVDIERCVAALKELTETVRVFDYVYTVRNLLLALGDRDTYMAVLRANAMILLAYGHGRLEGSNFSKKEVYFSNSLDPAACETVMDLEAQRRKILGKLLKYLSPMASSEQKLLTDMVKSMDCGMDFWNYYKNVPLDEFVYEIVPVSGTAIEGYVSNLYNEMLNEDATISPIQNMLPALSLKCRASLDKMNSLLLCGVIIQGKVFYPEDILKRRQKVIGSTGVNLEFKDTEMATLKSIHLKEVHNVGKYEEHYIQVTYSFKSGTARMFIMPLNVPIASVINSLVYDNDLGTFLVVLEWLGLGGYANWELDKEIVEEIVTSDDIEVYDKLRNAFVTVGEDVKVLTHASNFEITTEGSDTLDLMYVTSLGTGDKQSSTAKSFADKNLVSLGHNKTISLINPEKLVVQS